MARKIIAERDKKRVAELLGMGLTYDEAAGAKGIGSTSVERIMKEPAYRAIMEDVKKQRTSVAAQSAAVIVDLLNATEKDGVTPALNLRKIGAELYAKNPALVDAALEDTGDELLPGVVMRFPAPPGIAGG